MSYTQIKILANDRRAWKLLRRQEQKTPNNDVLSKSYSLRIHHERVLNELYGALRDSSEQLLGEGELALRYVQVGLLLCVAGERGVPADQDVGQHAHRPDVGC